MMCVEFAILFALALVVSAIGFKKFVWFISLGYGFSMAVIGVALLLMFAGSQTAVTLAASLLLVVYGLRLGIYLLVRERNSKAYNHVMKTQVNDGSGLSKPVQALVWIVCALMYACQASPVLWRLQNASGVDACAIVGVVIMVCGIVLESAADLQKTAQKRKSPRRFCDKGLFSFVRCPNYLGEVLCWTGMFVSGVTAYQGVWQWLAAIAGYVAIVYVMFGGARRLEIRQNKNYGADPTYQAYVQTTPILLPFVPLYSVEKYTWLKG